jgi:DNA-binding transcriptional LysR family regulator
MVAVRLTPPFKAIMVATPGYLATRPSLHSIADLKNHNCIGFRMLASRAIYAWDMQKDGKDIAVGVNGTALITDPSYARELALAGIGIAYAIEPLVRDDLRSKRLSWILPETAITEPGLFIYYPHRSTQAPKLRAFLEVAREICDQSSSFDI